MDLLATAAMISMVCGENARCTDAVLPAPQLMQLAVACCLVLRQWSCGVQSIITVVTGWFAMNLNNTHPQSYPWFYSVRFSSRTTALRDGSWHQVYCSCPNVINAQLFYVCRLHSYPLGSV
jgi:hypothetical protein